MYFLKVLYCKQKDRFWCGVPVCSVFTTERKRQHNKRRLYAGKIPQLIAFLSFRQRLANHTTQDTPYASKLPS